ncbi:hypothetical protein H0H87_007404 [Tephrocybe sp. NHM501043]|nr:hypothetical protein H0H87_007404 [Tephrocybe sp. NHM501043]
MLRTLFISVTLSALTLVLFRKIAATYSMSTSSWSSSFASWHTRAQGISHAALSTFIPSRDTLSLAVLLNAPAENEGFTLALFSQSKEDGSGSHVFAVDALGNTLLMAEKDASGILSLAKEASSLPQTETFRNTWVVKRPTTSLPIHRLFIFNEASGNNPHEISVQGFTKETKELKRPIQGNEELPQVLWELVGLVLEAREGVGLGASRNEVSLKKVREVVASLF